LPYSTVAEFQDLNRALVQLVDRSHTVYVSQKEFTENASHEIQTPLAVCRAKLEMLMQSRELSGEQAELIGSLYEATDRLTRLIRNLLLLSKIENNQFIEREDIALDEWVAKALGDFGDQVRARDLKIFHTAHPLQINGNPQLVEVLITNLVSNAVRYTPKGGVIRVGIANRSLTISNSGSIPLRHDRIFQRFYRESQTPGGSGLGLAIVKKIAEINGYEGCLFVRRRNPPLYRLFLSPVSHLAIFQNLYRMSWEICSNTILNFRSLHKIQEGLCERLSS
jgi:signal transduction histidine kinase